MMRKPRSEVSWIPPRLIFDQHALQALYDVYNTDDSEQSITFETFCDEVCQLPAKHLEPFLLPLVGDPVEELQLSAQMTRLNAHYPILTQRVLSRFLTQDDIVRLWDIFVKANSTPNRRWRIREFQQYLTDLPPDKFLETLAEVAKLSECLDEIDLVLAKRVMIVYQARLSDTWMDYATETSNRIVQRARSIGGVDYLSLSRAAGLTELIHMQLLIDRFQTEHLTYKTISPEQSDLHLQTYLEDIHKFVLSLGLPKHEASAQAAQACKDYDTIRRWQDRVAIEPQGSQEYDPERLAVLEKELRLRRRAPNGAKRKRDDSTDIDSLDAPASKKQKPKPAAHLASSIPPKAVPNTSAKIQKAPLAASSSTPHISSLSPLNVPLPPPQVTSTKGKCSVNSDRDHC
jgi:hypothetical protein